MIWLRDSVRIIWDISFFPVVEEDELKVILGY